MKIFTKSKIWKKIIILLLILLFFQIFIPKPSHAIPGDTLLAPVTSLFANLGDGIMNILQKTIMGMDASGVWVQESSNLWLKILIVVGAIVAATIAVASLIYTGGMSLTVIASAIGALVSIGKAAVVAYFAVSFLHFLEGRILFTRI